MARTKPYTEIGIRRLKCYRCGAQAEYQWSACADGNIWRPLCARCDVGLNAVALKFMHDPQYDEKMTAYSEMMGVARSPRAPLEGKPNAQS